MSDDKYFLLDDKELAAILADLGNWPYNVVAMALEIVESRKYYGKLGPDWLSAKEHNVSKK